MPAEQAITIPVVRREYEAYGERKTLKDWAKDSRCVIGYGALAQRLDRGWPLEEALRYPVGTSLPLREWELHPSGRFYVRKDAPHRPGKPPSIRHRGYEAFGDVKTLSDWADDSRCSVSIKSLRKRVEEGVPFERALTSPPEPPDRWEAFGESKSLRDWAADPRCHPSADLLYYRLTTLGIQPEEAITTPVRRWPVYEAFGEKRSLKEWAEDGRCVVSLTTVRNRLRKGWTFEKAISIRERDTKLYEAFGEIKNVAAWSRDPRCAVAKTTLRTRLYRGENFLEALTRGPDNEVFRAFWDVKRWLGDEGDLFEPSCDDCLEPTTEQGSIVLPKCADEAEPERSDGPITIEAFGETKRILDWSQDYRCVVPFEVLRGRLRRGIPPEEAITRPKIDRPKPYTLWGETKSLYAWARDPRCPVSFMGLVQRLDRGMMLEDAMTAPPNAERQKSPQPDRPKGVAAENASRKKAWWRQEERWEAFGECLTLAEWARHQRCAVGFSTLYKRVRAGEPLERALTRTNRPPCPVRAPAGKQWAAFGERKTLRQWATDPRCQVAHCTLIKRVQSFGWPLQEALTKPSRQSGSGARESQRPAPRTKPCTH